MRLLHIGLGLSAALAFSACVRPQEAPPPAPQPPAPLPQQAPPPPPPPPADWRDAPLSPGTWVYRGEDATSQALFGAANSEATFIVRCDRTRREISLWREATASGNRMTLRTTYGDRNLPVSVQAEPLAYVFATLPASDRLLDEIAFSRGRFMVEVPGTSMLIIPAWPEAARVVEDCRT